MLWQFVFLCFTGESDGSRCKGVMDGNLAEIPYLCPKVKEADARIIHMKSEGYSTYFCLVWQHKCVCSPHVLLECSLHVLLECSLSEGLREPWIRANIHFTSHTSTMNWKIYLLALVHTLLAVTI